MESVPNYDNVVFIDEYPELIKRREVKLALGGLKRLANSGGLAEVHQFQTPIVTELPRLHPDIPDGAA